MKNLYISVATRAYCHLLLVGGLCQSLKRIRQPKLLSRAREKLDEENIFWFSGAKVNLQDSWGRTALQFAKDYSGPDVIRILMDAGGVLSTSSM